MQDEDWVLLQTVWDYLVIDDEMPEKADAVVVGGSGFLTDGALRAAELYHRGVAPIVVVSGYMSPIFSGITTEADLLAGVLVERGVPSEAILRDHEATNTGENIINSADLLKHAGVNARKIVLVHKPFMTRRFLATALAQWPQSQPKLCV